MNRSANANSLRDSIPASLTLICKHAYLIYIFAQIQFIKFIAESL